MEILHPEAHGNSYWWLRIISPTFKEGYSFSNSPSFCSPSPGWSTLYQSKSFSQISSTKKAEEIFVLPLRPHFLPSEN